MATITPGGPFLRRPPQTVMRGQTPTTMGQTPTSFVGRGATASPAAPTQFQVGGDVGSQLTHALAGTASAANLNSTNPGQSRNSLLGMLNQDPSQMLSGYVASAMPEFNKALQGIRENAVQRGISTGDLGTSYEGDLASAFQRNIAGEAANLYGQRLGGFENLYGQDIGANNAAENQYLSLLTGQRDYQEQQREANQANQASMFGSLAQLGGMAAGFFL